MKDNTQPEALRLAEQYDYGDPVAHSNMWKAAVCNELRRQHARIAELEAHLEAIGAGGVGPLIGKPQEMPDMSAPTERGAKAWAGVDAQGLREGFTAADMATAAAQGFRDGVASCAASAPAPSGHIKEPYTVAEIKAKIASNDYSAELLLQHAMLHLDRLAASAGSEPVAWIWKYANGEEEVVFVRPERVKDMHPDTHDMPSKITPLYLHPSPSEGMVGWRLVPIEPTHEMKLAGFDAIKGVQKNLTRRTHLGAVWAAMIAAAPPTTSAGSGKGE